MHKNAKTKLLNLFILLKKNGIKKEKKFFSGKLTKRKYYAYDVFNNKKCFRRG